MGVGAWGDGGQRIQSFHETAGVSSEACGARGDHSYHNNHVSNSVRS